MLLLGAMLELTAVIDKLLALPDKELKSILRKLRKQGLVAQA
jgi:hypothetical protein